MTLPEPQADRLGVAQLSAAGVERAVDVLRPVVRRTPLEQSVRLSEPAGVTVLLKREDQQLARSYKIRGAHHLIAGLTAAERERGVVCASAGNHGQGLALSCATLGIRGRVVVPQNTPRQKRQRILALGEGLVDLVTVGNSYDEASAAAHADSESSGAVYVHPFDDPRTIVGQGTIGPELVEQAHAAGHELGTVVVPIGGGGLISGIALWLRERHPGIRIIGVEPAGAASMTAALGHGGPIGLTDLDTFIDGAAVGRVGELTYPIVRDLVDEVVTVAEGAVCTEMLALYQTEGVIAEPAGALASAAVGRIDPGGKAVAAIVSGGNNDVSRYAEIVERSLLHEGLRHYFLVTFPQEPGALRHFLEDVLIEGADIVVFEYVKKNNRETGPALVGIELERATDLAELMSRMNASPLTIELVPPGSPVFSFLL
ncbi:threonine ammonia-lyase IlvA [Nocardioides jensenii]|uniref:threonine ammonia-lyase IlvA n=1 Tax=Nocardioides jensenii TaxID=1843 RepID=UPI00082DED2F|nr:threonine ammonia-lyase IlvA [Nocardioides jensenii]